MGHISLVNRILIVFLVSYKKVYVGTYIKMRCGSGNNDLYLGSQPYE